MFIKINHFLFNNFKSIKRIEIIIIENEYTKKKQ